MSVLAHPGPFGLAPQRRRRHLTLVPASHPAAAPSAPERDRLADVLTLPPPASRLIAPAARPPIAARRAGAADVPLRLTVRGRRVLAALAFVVAAASGAAVGSAVNATAEPAVDVETITVTSGESLWSIAATLAGPGDDVRDVVSQIAALNGLEGSEVAAGQQLMVPASD